MQNFISIKKFCAIFLLLNYDVEVRCDDHRNKDIDETYSELIPISEISSSCEISNNGKSES